MKSAKRVPTPTITSASAASALAAPVPVTPIAPIASRMIGGGRRLAGLRLGDRNAAARAEVDQFALGVGIEHAAAADDERLLRAAQERGGVGDFARVGRDAALAMHAAPRRSIAG